MLDSFFSRFPLLSRVAVWFLFPIACLAITVFVLLEKSLPQEGRIHIQSDTGKSIVIKDRFAVPTIIGEQPSDGYYSLGYMHARERLWQMEMDRRIASGRLSEVFGSVTVGSDTFMRTIGLYENAKQTWNSLSLDQKKSLQTYVAGVNAGMAATSILPVEYYIAGIDPEPWTVYDSLVKLQLMAWSMSSSFNTDVYRLQLVRRYGVEKAAQVLPGISKNQLKVAMQQLDDGSSSSVVELLDTVKGLERVNKARGGLSGSNGWVVAGRHTATGKPFLANDPHQQFSIPSIWYMVKIDAGDLNVLGATLPGLPFVVIGRNQNVAWGLTNSYADTQDLRVERLSLTDENSYLVDGEYRQMEVRTERIKIKSDPFKAPIDPVDIKIRRTVHGPVISDVVSQSDEHVLSLQWSGDAGMDGTYSSFYKLSYAEDWLAFRDALKTYTAPSQNFVYADTEGNIGYAMVGKIPVRIKGDGAIPVPGWNSEYDWEKWIPFDKLPKRYNPESGIIVTANNKMISDDYPYHITYDWMPAYRAERITKLLNEKVAQKKAMQINDMVDIQKDTYSLFAKDVIPLLAKYSNGASKRNLKKAFNYINKWNGDVREKSVGATIFYAWVKSFNRLLLEDDLSNGAGRSAIQGLATEIHAPLVIDVLKNGDSEWCDYTATREKMETCSNIVILAMEAALDDLKKNFGGSMDRWEWGYSHKLKFTHYPYGGDDEAAPGPPSTDTPLHLIFDREMPASGGMHTIRAASVNRLNGGIFRSYLGSTYRQIMDLSSLDNSLLAIPTGQSGNVFSKHYDDFIRPYGEFEYLLPGKDELYKQADSDLN